MFIFSEAHGLQHATLCCPSPTPGVCPSPCSFNRKDESLWYLSQDHSLSYLSQLSNNETPFQIAVAKKQNIPFFQLLVRGLSYQERHDFSVPHLAHKHWLLRLNHMHLQPRGGASFFVTFTCGMEALLWVWHGCGRAIALPPVCEVVDSHERQAQRDVDYSLLIHWLYSLNKDVTKREAFHCPSPTV